MSKKIKYTSKKFDLQKELSDYHKKIAYLSANVPIECLCLPKPINSVLIREGVTRIFDLLDRDIKEIRGIGSRRASFLASRLYQFLAM